MENNLQDFSNIPDEQLISNETTIQQPGQSTNTAKPTDSRPAPVMDFFNSAANTKLSDDDKDESKPKEETPGVERPKGQVTLGKVISGKTTVKLINIFIPSFIVFALQKFGYAAQKSQLRLTKEEEEIMSPVVQDCLDYITINFDNPFYALAFVASMIYGAKVMDIIPDLKKIKDDVLKDDEGQPVKQAIVKEMTKRNVDSIMKPPEFNESLKQTVEEKPTQEVAPEFQEVRAKIDSTSIRKQKLQLIIECIEQYSPNDLIEMYKIYNGIYPHRNENYFREWYSNNVEAFPDHLRFIDGAI
jgi:hypothetical protein